MHVRYEDVAVELYNHAAVSARGFFWSDESGHAVQVRRCFVCRAARCEAPQRFNEIVQAARAAKRRLNFSLPSLGAKPQQSSPQIYGVPLLAMAGRADRC